LVQKIKKKNYIKKASRNIIFGIKKFYEFFKPKPKAQRLATIFINIEYMKIEKKINESFTFKVIVNSNVKFIQK
jgi:hypothetical protein